MKKNAIFYMLILLSFTGSSRAQVAAEKEDIAPIPIILVKASKNNVTTFLFKKNNITIYRLVCMGKGVQRTFFSADADCRITEYDLNFDGEIDAIQIGKDDWNFSPFLVETKNDTIDIVSLPDDWEKGSKYPFDTFMKYVKKHKKIE